VSEIARRPFVAGVCTLPLLALVRRLDNVLVADGSVLVTSGAHNPTLTIMAVALRNARHFA